MNKEEIKFMLDSGFELSEIMNMGVSSSPETPASSVEEGVDTVEPVAHEESNEVESTPTTDAKGVETNEMPEMKAMLDLVNKLSSQVDELKKEYQESNRKNDSFNPTSSIESVDDMLSRLINPDLNKENK